jgi:hypothetical protein
MNVVDKPQRSANAHANLFAFSFLSRKNAGAVTLSAPGFLVHRYFLRAHAFFRAFFR